MYGHMTRVYYIITVLTRLAVDTSIIIVRTGTGLTRILALCQSEFITIAVHIV